jgi:hypothetical protein
MFRVFLRTTSILLLSIHSGVSLKATTPNFENATISGLNQWWVDVGFGLVGTGEYPGIGLSSSLSFHRPAGFYTLHLLLSGNFTEESPQPPGANRGVPDAIHAFDGYYGLLWKHKYAYGAVNLGISVISSYYTRGHIKQEWRYLVGIPVMIQAYFTPLPIVGMGLTGSYTIISGPNIITLFLSLEMGRLR